MKLVESLERITEVKISKSYTLEEFLEYDKARIRSALFSGDKEILEILVATGLAMDERSALPLIKKFELNQHNYLDAVESVYARNSSLEFYNSMSNESMYKVTAIMALAHYQSEGDYTRKKQFYLSNFSRNYEKMIKTIKAQIANDNYSYGEFIKYNQKDTNLSATKRICDAALYFYMKEREPMENEQRGLNFPIHLLATDISNIIAALTRDTYLLFKENALEIEEGLVNEMTAHLDEMGIGRWKMKQKMPFYELFERYFAGVRIEAAMEDRKAVINYLAGNSETPVSVIPGRFLGCEFKYMEFVYVCCLAKEMLADLEIQTPDKVISFYESVIMTMVRVMERQQKVEHNKDYLTYRLLGKYQGIEVEIKNFQKEKRKVLADAEKKSLQDKQRWEREMASVRSELQGVKQELKLTIEKAKAEKSNETELERKYRVLQEELNRVQVERDNLLELNNEYENQNESANEVNEVELPQKIVFITGHPNLRNNVRERFGWETLDIDKLNETSKLAGAELILYNSYSNSHTIFRKLTQNDLNKVVYTHGGTNLDIIEILAKKGWKTKREEVLNYE